MLRKVGFTQRPGKGSHTKWLHPNYPGRITLSGKDGADAKPYQEQEVNQAIRVVQKRQKDK